MTTEQILLAAADLVLTGWTQGTDARDKDGQECDPRSPEAVCWCGEGAIYKAAPDVESAWRAWSRASDLARVKHGARFFWFNDTIAKSPKDVANLLREAAA